MIHNKRKLQFYTAGILTVLMVSMGFLWATHALSLYRATIERQIAEDNNIVKDNLSIIIRQITREYTDREKVIEHIQKVLEALQAKGWNGFACILDENGRILAHPDLNMVDMRMSLKVYDPLDVLGSLPPPVSELSEVPDVTRAIYKTSDDIIAIDWLPELQTYLCVHKSHHPVTERINALRRRLISVGFLFVAVTAAMSWFFVGGLVDRYESHLARSEARNRTLVQNSASMLVVSPSGKILDANPEAEMFFHLERAALLSRPLKELWSEKHQNELSALLAVVPGRAEERRDLDLRTGTGSVVPADVRACRIDYDDREAVYLLIRDVTQTRRAREEILAANRRLRQLDQLKTDFVHTVSHELRTPLTSIRWSTESLSDLVADDEGRIGRLFKIIRNDSQRLSKLIEDLLGFSRFEAGKLKLNVQNVDLSQIVQLACEEITPLAQKKSIDINNAGGSAVSALRGDPEQLRRVVINLLDNAIKYTPEGGCVTIRTVRDEDRGVLEVTDSGIGIPEEDLPYIFDKFYRTQQAGTQSEGGTGLGLAIVKGIVDAHGGRIAVKSRVGNGTTFTVQLPLDGTQVQKLS